MQRTVDRSGALWVLQAASGLLLIVVLGLHMAAQHFVVDGGLRGYHDVLSYVANPLILGIEVIFLLVVTIHAMLGMRAILMDFGPAASVKTIINWGTTLVGGLVLGYGLWLAAAIQALK